MSTVVITHHANIEIAISEALNLLPLAKLVKSKLVAVKPNETWASAEDTTAVCQPDTLRAVLQALKRQAPRELIVSGGAGAGETEAILRIAKLMEVIEEEQATFFDHNRGPFQEVQLEYAPDKDVDGPQKSVVVNPRVLEYQTLVSLAQLKMHETATVTLSLKNIAMSYPAADYYGHPRSEKLHPHQFFEDMHSFIAGMAKRFPIQLAIIVGHPAMIGTGPLGGYAVNTGLVIASTDAIAADVVGAQLLGFKPQGVRHLWEAGRLGLGETEIENMTFPALSLSEAVGLFTKAAYGQKLKFHGI
jgi:uncharacterized protein (DUF362 family)